MVERAKPNKPLNRPNTTLKRWGPPPRKKKVITPIDLDNKFNKKKKKSKS